MQPRRKPDGRLEALRANSDLAALRLKVAAQRVREAIRLEARYNASQPRVPVGNPDGGQWTIGDGPSPGSAFDSSRIIAAARRATLHVAAISKKRQLCLALCAPILERPTRAGSDVVYWDFQKCMNACLGKNI